jgi:hypothetical protein
MTTISDTAASLGTSLPEGETPVDGSAGPSVTVDPPQLASETTATSSPSVAIGALPIR